MSHPQTHYTLDVWSRRGCRPRVRRGGQVDIRLEVGLKKAIDWISQRRRENPSATLATLVDEACRRFDLDPIQADFLHRHFTQG